MASILITLLLVWVVWMVAAWILQGYVIFPRRMAADRAMPGPPEGVEAWTLDIGADKPVEAWFVPSASQQPSPAIVIIHGNAELIDDQLDTAESLAAGGVHVLLPEYRGYGRSGGSPGERAIVGDVSAFVDRLLKRPDVDADHVAYIGRSIGCGVATGVAADRPPAALVLMMPPARIDTMAWKLGVPPFLVRHPFRSDRVLSELDAPVLILARSHDEIIPASHPKLLHEIAPNSELVIIDGTHNAVASEAAARKQRAAIAAFLLKHGVSGDVERWRR